MLEVLFTQEGGLNLQGIFVCPYKITELKQIFLDKQINCPSLLVLATPSFEPFSCDSTPATVTLAIARDYTHTFTNRFNLQTLLMSKPFKYKMLS